MNIMCVEQSICSFTRMINYPVVPITAELAHTAQKIL